MTPNDFIPNLFSEEIGDSPPQGSDDLSISAVSPSTGAGHFQAEVHRSYATLLTIAQSLDQEAPGEEGTSHMAHLGEVVARFVEQIVWADQRIAGSEAEAIAGLVDLDASQGGTLGECLRNPCGELTELSLLPAFLQGCVAHDREGASSFAATAMDAFESLGLSLMASDRDIDEAEVELTKTILGGWRQAIQMPYVA